MINSRYKKEEEEEKKFPTLSDKVERRIKTPSSRIFCREGAIPVIETYNILVTSSNRKI